MASAYLSRTQGTPTNTDIGTISFWVKRGTIDKNNEYIIQNYIDGSNYGYIRGKSDNQLQPYSASANDEKRTNRVFRDTSGWYHIVLRVDTTQGTASDRVRLYVNGVQETSFQTSTNASQNADYDLFKSGGTMRIGYVSSGTATYFDGQLAHFHYADGQSYAPTVFGETDATTGIWKSKTSPTVTYGNQGFFLKFDNSANMGLDSSGQSNNFTTSGTIIQTKDTPSNVFNTWNPLENFYDNGTFTNTNSTYQSNNSTYSRNTTTLGMSKGKYYWEVKIAAVNQQSDYFPHVGITSTDITDNQDFVGKKANDYSWGTNSDGSNVKKWNNNQQAAYGTNFAVGDIVGVALDLDNNKLYFSKNGTFQESGDPTSGSTGTGAAFTVTAAASTPLGAYFPSVSNYDGTGNATFQANFGNGYFGTTAVASAENPDDGVGIFEYDVPAGYRAICTKSLNAQEYS